MRRLRLWQAATAGLLFIGYSGYYLCRSHLSVCQPLILAEMRKSGVSAAEARLALGWMATLGTLAYAAGKFLFGGLGDFVGGKRSFVLGMTAAVVCTVAFAAAQGIGGYSVAWALNRFLQSMGWVGLVKLCGRWYPQTHHSRIIAILSLSFLFGDAAAQEFMGQLLDRHLGWREVFLIAAGVLGVILVLNVLFLHESPRDVGESEPSEASTSLFANAGEARPTSLGQLLRPFASSGSFRVVCAISFGFTILRETFNTWRPTYFVEHVGLGKAAAAHASAQFPLWGGVSAILAGYLGDKLGRSGKSLVLTAGLALAAVLLLILALADFKGSRAGPVAIMTAIGFVLMGPYTYLAGAIALEFGGKAGASTSAGIIDGVGYLGGILAGFAVAKLSNRFGWSGAFLALSGTALVSAIPSAWLWVASRSPKNQGSLL